MTAGIETVAQRLHAATRPLKRGAWEALAPYERYRRKAAIGEAVLPALIALPERPTVGARPEFTAEEYAAAVESTTRDLVEHRTPGAWEGMSARKRKRMVSATAALTRAVVAAMPVRQDPDALTIPDSL